MATKKEKQLTVLLLKERLERLTGKKVVLEEDYKDEQRIQQIQSLPDDKQIGAASKMAKSIDNPIKLWNRYEAAVKVFGKDSPISQAFYARAEELQHPETIIGKQNADLKAKRDKEKAERAGFQQQALQQANPRDIERVKEIKAKGKNSTSEGRIGLIKDPSKAWNRYLASVQEFGEGDWVTRMFLNRAVELAHPEAVRISSEMDKSNSEMYKTQREQSIARKKLKATQFAKEFNARYSKKDMYASVDSDGDVEIKDENKLLSKGLAGLSDQRALSPMHQGIRNLANKFGGYYNYNYGRITVKF